MVVPTINWTLDDYLLHLFETGQTQSSEFQCLLRIYGRERIEKTWKLYRSGALEPKEPPKERFNRYRPIEKEDD